MPSSDYARAVRHVCLRILSIESLPATYDHDRVGWEFFAP